MKKVTTFEESSCSGNPVTVFKAISDIQTLVVRDWHKELLRQMSTGDDK